MSNFRVQLDNPSAAREPTVKPSRPMFDGYAPPRRRSRKIITILGSVLAGAVLVAGVTGYLYYRSLKQTPQYSLALLVDAANRDDKAEIDSVVDINSVVDDFVPQITGKAIELYGRGQPPEVLSQAARLAVPIMPAVKQRARAELPRVIRERTARFSYVPFFAMVMGAERYLDVTVTGDAAIVKSKVAEHPLEMKMRRNGDRWQIVGVREEQLATEIARKIGQDIIAVAKSGGTKNAADRYGLGNLSDLLRQAEGLVK